MEDMYLVGLWIAEIVPLLATLFSFVYGTRNFFRQGKPLFLQSITMAMGCHSLGSIYHLCQTLTTETVLEGFTPAYLGRIGFFLFLMIIGFLLPISTYIPFVIWRFKLKKNKISTGTIEGGTK